MRKRLWVLVAGYSSSPIEPDWIDVSYPLSCPLWRNMPQLPDAGLNVHDLLGADQLVHPMGAEPWELRDIDVGLGHKLKATPVFDTYWRFAARRQELFMHRILDLPPPEPPDPVLSAYRFTNPYRASDRVSQYLIRHVLYAGDQSTEEICFRCLLFKFFNRIETWEYLTHRLGPLSSATFDPDRYSEVLDELLDTGRTVYSPAYIMPCPQFDHPRKHGNHLRLLDLMLSEDAPRRVQDAGSLEGVYEILKGYESIGPFLAFQFAIDLNYSTAIDFSEMDFVVAGPGARRGIRKCFADTGGLDDADVIRAVGELAGGEFDRLDLSFSNLWGRHLHLIDIQNLFCEVDKYARVVHPHSLNQSKRTRIKQKYSPNTKPLPQWYPPKWGIDLPSSIASESQRATTP